MSVILGGWRLGAA